MSDDVLNRLAAVLEQRRTGDPATSYVARLYQAGLNKIRQKIGEEATEVVIATGERDEQAIVNEVADLWFHCLIALAHHEIAPQRVLDELERRFGLSGIEEKASRRTQ